MEFCVKLLSLPLWERGLKFPSAQKDRLCGLSLPLWERGLKYPLIMTLKDEVSVAPLVGAWIEMI